MQMIQSKLQTVNCLTLPNLLLENQLTCQLKRHSHVENQAEEAAHLAIKLKLTGADVQVEDKMKFILALLKIPKDLRPRAVRV